MECPVSGLAADALGAREVGALMFPISQAFVTDAVLVPDDAIAAAQRLLWDQMRLIASELRVVRPPWPPCFVADSSRRKVLGSVWWCAAEIRTPERSPRPESKCRSQSSDRSLTTAIVSKPKLSRMTRVHSRSRSRDRHSRVSPSPPVFRRRRHLPLRGRRCSRPGDFQALVNPMYAVHAMPGLRAGEAPRDILASLAGPDEGADQRQFHILDATGRIAQHTGSNCVSWAGHVAAENVSVAGNMLAGEATVRATMEAFLSASGSMVERLLTAMEAGEKAGGDKRGKQSAGLKIASRDPYPDLDIRADDHPGPVV